MSIDSPTHSVAAWLIDAAQRGASDLHLVVGYAPILRLHGELIHLDVPPLDEQQVTQAITAVCSQDQLAKFQQVRNLDFAYEIPIDAAAARRFRVNCFYSGRQPGACFRIIPASVPELTWANFPVALARRLAEFRNGLIVFSGVTGSGKTTSMAMMIDMLSQQGGLRMITIEDPIEYRFKHSDSVITQRELGRDVDSFADGLKYALRQDPDVILVGEIRDQETARMALSAAETGHLVLTTMHTRDAKGAVTRFADLFPSQSQSETCSLLAIGLRAVISQHLLPSPYAGEKRELALEVLFNTHPVASAIRQGRFDNIDTAIVTGKKDGQVSLDDSIVRLLSDGRITDATAERFISDKSLLPR